MKKHRLSLILVSLLVFTFIVGIFSISVLGSSTLTYTIDNGSVADESNPSIETTFNMRNQTTISDTYNGTYSFTNVADGGFPVDWEKYHVAEVLSDYQGHGKVLRVGNASFNYCFNQFSIQTNGIVEMFINVPDVTARIQVSLINNGKADLILLRMHTNELKYYDGGSITATGLTMEADKWYHIKLQFFVDDTFDYFIDGLQYANGADFLSPGDIYGLEFNTYTDYLYVDGIGYSWNDYYNEGDNIAPLSTYNNTLETDKYEFTYEAPNDFYEVGDTPVGWTKLSTGVGGAITIGGRVLDYNKELFMIAGNGVGTLGIEKTTFNVAGQIFNVSLDVYFFQWDDTGDDISFTIKSQDTSSVYILNIETNGDLNWWDGGSLIELDTGLTIGVNYTFNFFIDYGSDTCLIRRWDDGVFDSIYLTPLAVGGKQGLDEIVFEIYTFSAGDYVGALVDSIGVYKKGKPLVVEYGWISHDLNSTEAWDFQNQNLFTMNASGYFTTHGSGGGSYRGEVSNFETPITHTVFNDEVFFNIYEVAGDSLPDPYLVLYFNGDQYYNNISYLNIEGVKLEQGANEYWLDFTYANVDINQSYFFVDSSRKLRFNITYDSSNLEYIQGDFDIVNVLSENRSWTFKTKITGAYGYFTLGYLDGSSTVEMGVDHSTFNINIPQTKTIDRFTVLATDNNEFNSTLANGYVSTIKLIWNPSISITLVTISLIMVMIPIIIMIVPTLTIYSKYGKSVIVPVFVLMSIICFASGLIPIGVFFVLMVATGGFLVIKGSGDV